MPITVKKHLFFWVLFSSLLWAIQPTLKSIDGYPRCIAKDFYIWYFLHHKLSPKAADKLFAQTSNVSMKLLRAYTKKANNPLLTKALACQKLPILAAAKKHDKNCLAMAITPYKASTLSPNERSIIAKKLIRLSPRLSKQLFLMNQSYKSQAIKDDPENFLELFIHSGKSFRLWHYNRAFDITFLKSLIPFESFDKFIEIATFSPKMDTLQKALTALPFSKKFLPETAFNLAIINIIQDNIKGAMQFLKYVSNNAFLQMDRDKAIFWIYLLTKKSQYLKQLYRSTDLNIYTIYAAELLKKDPIGVFTPHFDSTKPHAIDESNPFAWIHLISDETLKDPEIACKKLPTFKSPKNQATYAFLLERCGNYALHPFITPYLDELDSLNNSKKALFYAIGRQESRLIPGGISSSYAMGMMQIMPFLSKAIAKQRNERLHLPDMFHPKKNIAFAKQHLNFLYKRLKHPLLIAYAYNGGIGYVKRLLKGYYFKKGLYEPFLSMERISYKETREYGKKVLANYVIYKKLFNEPISLIRLFDRLK